MKGTEMIKDLWRGLFSGERRRAERRTMPGLVAFYWDGGIPAPRSVREISLTGMYLVTEERWYLGTIVRLVLQQMETTDADADRSITIQAKAVRWGKDGVGLLFLPQEQNFYENGHDLRNSGDDLGSIKRFVREK